MGIVWNEWKEKKKKKWIKDGKKGKSLWRIREGGEKEKERCEGYGENK